MKPRMLLVTLCALLATAVPSLTARQVSPRLSERQVTTLLSRTQQDIDQFRRSVDMALGRSFPAPRSDNDITQYVLELSDSFTHFRTHAERRQVIASDVDDLLARSGHIDGFLSRNRLGTTVTNNWAIVRRDLDEIARTYDVTWSWNDPRAPVPGPEVPYERLSGTYQLDRARSDNPQVAADRATRTAPAAQRERLTRVLTTRLEAPEALAIDRSRDTVSIASSLAPRVQFDVTGLARTEPWGTGRTATTRAEFYGDQLMVSTTGVRGNEFTVTFEPISSGNELLVTRRVDSEGLSQSVTTRSYYRKTSDQPDWSLYTVDDSPSSVAIPDGTVLNATLNTALNTRTSREGDRFTATVRSPNQYNGAIVEGVVSRLSRSTQNGNRTTMVLMFDQIELRNGRTSGFDGVLEGARTPNGDRINIDVENTTRTPSEQTDEAIKRGSIGAAIGAIIGAIAAGGKGAAIGAVVGAGGGASTVFLDSGTEFDLPRGTDLTIRSLANR